MTERPIYALGAVTSPERRALMEAALREVAQAQSTAIPLGRLAKSAGQSHWLARSEFGSADSLIVESAISTARDALAASEGTEFTSPFEHFESLSTALMDHFGRHRVFYRAVLTGPLAPHANTALDELVRPMNELIIDSVSGANATSAQREQTAEFFTARSRQIVGKWLTDVETTETSADITPRLRRIVETLRSAAAPPRPGPRSNI